MENDIVKQVFERIVAIDEEANAKLNAAKEAVSQREQVLKQEFRKLELETMKEVRTRVKSEFTTRIADAQNVEQSILEQSQNFTDRVHIFFDNHKEAVVSTLFDDIFKVE